MTWHVEKLHQLDDLAYEKVQLLLCQLDDLARVFAIRTPKEMDSIGDVVPLGDHRGSRTLQRLIDDVRQSGIQPTHFLHVSFRFSVEGKKKSSKVRKMLFEEIKNKRYIKRIADDDEVYIKWTTLNAQTSTLYHTTSRFEETYVRQITQEVLTKIFYFIIDTLQLTTNDVELSYLTTKNMNYEINLNTLEQVVIGTLPQAGAPDGLLHEPFAVPQLEEGNDASSDGSEEF